MNKPCGSGNNVAGVTTCSDDYDESGGCQTSVLRVNSEFSGQ